MRRDRRFRLAGFLALAITLTALPIIATVAGTDVHPNASTDTPTTDATATINNISINGSTVTTTHDGRRVVWLDSTFKMTIHYSAPNRSTYQLCVWTEYSTETRCKQPALQPRNRTSITFDQMQWPGNDTGSLEFTAQLRADNEVLDTNYREILVLERNTSYDGDSIQNARELELNTSVLVADTDHDGLKDGVEIRTYHTDPLNPDSDYDGLNDPREIELGTNPLDADTDDDGLEDGRELDVGASPFEVDTDGDGLDDVTEVRIGTNPANPLTPYFLGIGLVATTVVGGLLISRQWSPIPVTWKDRVQLFPIVPTSLWQDSGPTDETGADPETPESDADGNDIVVNGVSESNIDPEVAGIVETDEERVLKILNQHNGRIRQTHLVDAQDWSASKVSRLLSDMEDADEISKMTIGRENIVTLPGEEPSTGSTTED